ncbi:MAG: response regulator [Bacteroidales bacterium]|nr:response regulator [Bacteroidales bacterium]MBS3776617.1 response regulator [Bacteroidales bacterium]
MQDKDWSDRVILIAEDEKINYLYLKSIFDKTGASTLWARSGSEAVQMCREHPVDIVLMDIKMPGTDGNEATRNIKALNSDIAVIVQTSYTMKEDSKKAFEAGCDTFLSKPVRPKNLLAIVEKYI